MMNLLTTCSLRIENTIKRNKLSNCSAYLFGSILNNEETKEVDAMIVFNESDIKIAIEIRTELKSEFLVNGLILDMLLLTTKEFDECKESMNWRMIQLSLSIDNK